ncbi:MAG: Membrane protein-like protein [Candidatus Kaiserbacteria bacterium]|nr:Membrane protein-like protein [Candidatus Kaiserbacteria bacterium]
MTQFTLYRTYFLTLGLMTGVCIISYFLFLGQSIRLDEAQTLWQTGRYPGGILYVVAQDVHVPLYHMMIYFWQLIFGVNIEFVRLFSLLFFVLTIPLVIRLGDEVYESRLISGTGAAIFALSPFMIWYGNEARMYSLLVFLTVLNQYLFVRIRKTGQTQYWIAYGITAILGAYTHYYFGLVLITQGMFYLFHRSDFPERSFRKFVIAAAAVLLSLAPWLLYVRYLGKISNSEPLLHAPGLIDIFNTYVQFIFGIQSVPINTFIVALWPIVMLVWLFAIKKYAGSETIDNRYLLTSIVIPVGVGFVVSIFVRPIFEARYLIFVLPACALLLSALINSAEGIARSILTTILFVSLIVSILVVSLNPNTPTKENYATVATYLDTYANPQDVIIVSAPFTIYPIEYYYQGPVSISTLPLWNQHVTGPIPPFNPDTFPNEVKTVTGSHQRAWLLLSYDQGYEKTIRDYFDNHYRRLELITISPGMTLALYQLRYDTADSVYKDRAQ